MRPRPPRAASGSSLATCIVATTALVAALAAAAHGAAPATAPVGSAAPKVSAARLTPEAIDLLLAGASEARPLTAAEALSGTFTSNPAFVGLRLAELRAVESVAGARAALFLPSLTGGIGFDSSTSVATSTLSGVDVIRYDSFRVAVGLVEPLPTGGAIALSASDTRSSTNDEALLEELRTSLGASVTVSVSQPLLRGCCLVPPRAGFLLARDDLHYARLVLQRALNSVAADVLNAYWDLAFARRDLELKIAALANLDRRAAWTERSIAEGRIAKTDAVQVASSRAIAVEDYLRVANALLDAEERFKTLTGLSDVRPGLRLRPIPADDPPLPEGEAPSADAVYALAAERNYDLLALRAELARRRLDRDLAKEALWPSLDLGASYTFRGTGSDRAGELRDLADPGTASWGVSLSFSYPLFDTPGKAAARAATHAVTFKETELRHAERAVREEVDAVTRRLIALKAIMELVGERRALAEVTLHAEEEKFADGRSTPKDLLEFQEALERARVSEARARYDLAKGLVALDRVKGTLVRVTEDGK